jgi:hypothetical protein
MSLVGATVAMAGAALIAVAVGLGSWGLLRWQSGDLRRDLHDNRIEVAAAVVGGVLLIAALLIIANTVGTS